MLPTTNVIAAQLDLTHIEDMHTAYCDKKKWNYVVLTFIIVQLMKQG